jgi:hypothetical protein
MGGKNKHFCPCGKYAQTRASTLFFAELRIFFPPWEGFVPWHAGKPFKTKYLGFGTLLTDRGYTRNRTQMKQNTAITLTFRLALAAAILFAGFTSAVAQTTSNKNGVTPALLLSFDGQVNNDIAMLNWVMENETNCKWFVIERSGETGGYDSISVVDGLNDNNMTTYSFSDGHMVSGNNYYRLRQVDRDGVVRYSKVVTLTNNADANAGPKMSVYPNPAAATLNYSVSSVAPQQVIVQVYNLAGVVCYTSQQQLYTGANQQSITLSGLKNGNYFLKVTNREGSTQYIQPFVKMM